MAWQLRKPADGDRKYLFERERVNLEKQALTLMRRILRANADQLLNKEPDKEDGAQGWYIYFHEPNTVGGSKSELGIPNAFLILNILKFGFHMVRTIRNPNKQIGCHFVVSLGRFIYEEKNIFI